jgi:protein TonB
MAGCYGNTGSDIADGVPAANLRALKSVMPKYPPRMQEYGESGTVEMSFTVTRAGKVRNIKVVHFSGPPEMVDSATSALNEWRFEPIVRDGKPVEQRAHMTMQFVPKPAT